MGEPTSSNRYLFRDGAEIGVGSRSVRVLKRRQLRGLTESADQLLEQFGLRFCLDWSVGLSWLGVRDRVKWSSGEYLWHSSDIDAWLTQPRLLPHPIHFIQYQHLNSLIKSPMHKLITAHKLTLPIGSLPVIWITTFVATMIALSRIGFGRAGISKGELALLVPPRLHSHPIHQTQAHPHRPSSPTSMALLLPGVGASPN